MIPFSKRSRGVALVAVLWMVAAMSLIVAGIVQAVRSEILMVGLQHHSVGATAQADAAILLTLQRLSVQSHPFNKAVQNMTVEFDGATYNVAVESLNGYIDINSASLSLLVALYTHAGELPPQAAQALAEATIKAREAKNLNGESRKFEAREDLLGVPQMTYGLYAKLADLITVDVLNGSGRVNPRAAPPGVLNVLLNANAARTSELVAQRNTTSDLMDTSFFDPAHIEGANSQSIRLQVGVSLADGGSLTRVWHVYWGTDPRSGLPWRVLAKIFPVMRSN